MTIGGKCNREESTLLGDKEFNSLSSPYNVEFFPITFSPLCELFSQSKINVLQGTPQLQIFITFP